MHTTPVAQAVEGECLLRGVIAQKPKIAYFRGLSRVSAVLADATGQLSICWFNEPWMVQQTPVGKEIALYGRIQVKNGARLLVNPRLVTEEGWLPVYRSIRGIPGKLLRGLIHEALSRVEEICPEALPSGLRKRHYLLSLPQALCAIHRPESLESLQEARRRVDFEQMLLYLMRIRLVQQQVQEGWPMPVPEESLDAFWQAAPFPPTRAQRRVLEEIAADLRRDQAMSRLVQGDVGCGKTMLAFGAIYLSWRAGFQSAMMAPTEVLARQHYENARTLLQPLGIECALLTGSTKARERREILARLHQGAIAALFGTHALISRDVAYGRLGLVITDEQHRFGVRQRSSLQEKGQLPLQHGKAPHVLVMSATPIPRTLALILYGDLNLSLVDEMPPGRRPVQTRMVPEARRDAMYQFVREAVEKKGQQAYVVCPLVEDSETQSDLHSAQSIFEELSSHQLQGLRLAKTWGTQKSEEKAETLRRFAAGEIDVLVATTVIEVGVNVPNATVMVIENAEKYGLSQLHQLRGRVGRGTEESWCFLLGRATSRLNILCQTNDGFLVAQKDLELRGPGDLMGTRQSGDAADRLLSGGNLQLLGEAQDCVRRLTEDPALAEELHAVEALTIRQFSDADLKIALN